jgi:hypothetical protein
VLENSTLQARFPALNSGAAVLPSYYSDLFFIVPLRFRALEETKFMLMLDTSLELDSEVTCKFQK